MRECLPGLRVARWSVLVAVAIGWSDAIPAADQPQWGVWHSRNMVSTESGLPDSFNPTTGELIKWSVELGQTTYGTPIISGGRVLIGTNNANPRDPKHEGDRGVLMCFDESSGEFLWQLVIPKIDQYQDWPNVGLTSVPTVEGDRIYTITNRCEVMCLDINGQADGNQGPYQEEDRYTSPSGDPIPIGEKDADILWVTSMIDELGVFPHDSPHGSVLVDGPYLYACTSNGVDASHLKIPSPEAPSLAVFDKETGKIVGMDGEGMGPRTVHCTWSSPSLGTVNGKKSLFFGGGDGVCYAFEPFGADLKHEGINYLRRIWRFDCDPEGPKENVQSYKGNRKVSASNITGMPVFDGDSVFVEAGGDLWHGKNEVWLKCIDATQTGTTTQVAQRWSYPLVNHCMSTPAVTDDFVFIGDCGKHVHCIDRRTGDGLWKHNAEGEIWGSPLVADGKVYIGTLAGVVWVFAAEKELKVISRIEMDGPVHATPSAANGVLFIASMNKLYAVD